MLVERGVLLAVLTAGLLVVPASPALADHGRVGAAASPHAVHARLDHRLYGLVPSARAGGRRSGRPTQGEFAGSSLASTNNLNYNGGPVMATNTTYAIYWLPSGYSMSASYQTVINQFFTDVATAKNATDNVYATDTQYYGPGQAYIANNSSFAGSAVANDPLPADQCSSEYAGSGVSVSGCVTDAQVQNEINTVIARKGWTPRPGTEFFLFTPRNLGSCFDTWSGQCAFTYYCAYHSNATDSSGHEVLYASQPYTETNGIGAPGACASGQNPNGDQAADSTINVVSHEHNETITDPLGTAWYDSSGNENGDKCAWNFGTASGPAGAQYNQTINGHNYYLQQEWSNASAGCALKYGTTVQPSLALQLPATSNAGQPQTGSVTIPQAVSGSTTVALTSTGSGVLSPTSVTIPAGSTTGSFTYTDNKAETTTVTASALGYNSASQTETVSAGPASSVTVSPTTASVGLGGSQVFTATGKDRYGNVADASGTTWTTTAPGSVAPTTGGSTTFTASSTTTGIGSVTATLNGATASATVTVTSIPNPIVNGGFQSGSLSGWTRSGTSAETVVSTGYPCYSDGEIYCAQLGSTSPTNGNSNIAQTFTAPSGSSSLSFYYDVVCTDTVRYDWATATLKDVTTGTTYTVLPRTCTNNGSWVKVSHAVTAGHRYTLTLTNRDDNYPGDPTYTLYDDVAVH